MREGEREGGKEGESVRCRRSPPLSSRVSNTRQGQGLGWSGLGRAEQGGGRENGGDAAAAGGGGRGDGPHPPPQR